MSQLRLQTHDQSTLQNHTKRREHVNKKPTSKPRKRKKSINSKETKKNSQTVLTQVNQLATPPTATLHGTNTQSHEQPHKHRHSRTTTVAYKPKTAWTQPLKGLTRQKHKKHPMEEEREETKSWQAYQRWSRLVQGKMKRRRVVGSEGIGCSGMGYGGRKKKVARSKRIEKAWVVSTTHRHLSSIVCVRARLRLCVWRLSNVCFVILSPLPKLHSLPLRTYNY